MMTVAPRIAMSVMLLLPTVAMGKPKLAVMSIRDQTRSLGRDLQESLTDVLRTQLAQGQRFIVIDKSRQAAALKRLVARQKRASYRTCYDERCQIPLGQALAADTILRTQVTRVGSYYLINAELVDLAKEAVTGAAQTRVQAKPRRGRDDRLLQGFTAIARQLTHSPRAGLGTLGMLSSKGGGGSGSAILYGGRLEPTDEDQEAARRRQADLAQQRELQHAQEQEQRRAEARARQKQYAEARARQQAEQRERLEAYTRQQAQQAQEREQREVRARRLTRGLWGWTAVISGGILAATGVYYVTIKVGDAEDRADQATSPTALQTAYGEARDSRSAGFWLLGIGGAAAGLGAYLLLTLPRLEPSRTTAVSVGPVQGGVTLGWSGRF